MDIKKVFLEGMDADNSPKAIGAKSYLNLMNGRVGISSDGRNLRVENLKGTRAINQSVYPPYGVHFCIGSGVDDARSRIVYMLWNSFGDHGIYCLDIATGNVYAVLYDTQVTGGLNFTKSKRINRNVVVIGDLVYWTNNDGDPCRMNIEAGIKMNHASYNTTVLPYSYPMNKEVITIIRRPAPFDPDIEKKYDAGYVNNFIADEATQYALSINYRDFEYSVIGAWSIIAPRNFPLETNNYVQVTYPLTSTFDQDVLTVDLIVRYGNEGKSFIIKTWDRTAINAHNAATTQLSFDFYNDKTGIPVGNARANKPFDSVPRETFTIETVRNRMHLGNNLEGYDTPTTTSLTGAAAEVTSGASDQAGRWEIMEIDNGAGGTINRYFLVVPGLSPSMYYFSTGDVAAPPTTPPTSISAGIAIYSTSALHQMASEIAVSVGQPSSQHWGTSTTIYTATVGGGTSVLSNGSRSFKSGVDYRYAIVFYDKYRRKCGVVIPDNNRVTMPERSYSQTVYNIGINWTLSNLLAVNEIPDWAYYYSIVRTRCLTTRNFVQIRSGGIRYVTKDNNGNFDYNGLTYANTYYGIGVDISTLVSYGIGYTFAENDLASLYFGTGVSGRQQLRVIAQDGKWVILSLKDLGTFSNSVRPLIELFTPYKEQINEFYYEVGVTYAITNPGTISRTYSATSGTLNGDVYLVIREDTFTLNYFAEVMSPNDRVWYSWQEDIGWPNIVDKIGAVRKTTNISWSNTYVQGSKVNGLSSFDAIDEENLSLELGAIQKLQLTSKINNEQGGVMLGICYNQTVSMYIGEVQLVGANKDAYVAQSLGVIGTINTLKGDRGTQHPESVIAHDGLVFFLDVSKGEMMQYSANGLDPVSINNMVRFFKNYCAGYTISNANDLDNINGFHHIATGIDPFSKELLVTLPGLIYDNYAEILPSYSTVPSYASSILNRFDVYDQLGKTMVYQFNKVNRWESNLEFMPEWTEYINNDLYAFKNGIPYKCNDNAAPYNTFFGVQRPLRLCYVVNEIPSGIMDAMNMKIEGSAAPDFTVVYTKSPNIQITDITADQFVDNEGVWDAYIYRDRLSPNATGTADERIFSGDVMKGDIIYVMLEYRDYSELVFIDFVNMRIEISKGMKNLIPK